MNKIMVHIIIKFIIAIFYLLLPINNACAIKKAAAAFGKTFQQTGPKIVTPVSTGYGRTQTGTTTPQITVQLPGTTGSYPSANIGQGRQYPSSYIPSFESTSIFQEPYSESVVHITPKTALNRLTEELNSQSTKPIPKKHWTSAVNQVKKEGYRLGFVTQRAANNQIALEPLEIQYNWPINAGFQVLMLYRKGATDPLVFMEPGEDPQAVGLLLRTPETLQPQSTQAQKELEAAQQRAQEKAKKELAALEVQKAADALKAKEIEAKNQREMKDAKDVAEMEVLLKEIEETEIKESIEKSAKEDLEKTEKYSKKITAERQKLELELAKEEQELTALEQERHIKKSEHEQQLEKINQETAQELAKEKQDKKAFLAEQKINATARKKELEKIETAASLQAQQDALKAEQDLIETQTKLDNATIKIQQEEINVQIKQKQLEKEEQDIKKLEKEHADIENTIKEIKQNKEATQLNLTAQLKQIEADAVTGLAQAEQNYIKDLKKSKATLSKTQSFINLNYNEQQSEITKLENESKAKATATELSITTQKEDAAKQNQETAIKEQQEYDAQQAELQKSKDAITNLKKTKDEKAQQFALEIQQIKDLKTADKLKLLDLQNNIKTIQQQKDTAQLSLTKTQEQIIQAKKELEAIQPSKTAEVIQQEKNQITLKAQEAEQTALADLSAEEKVKEQQIQEKLAAAKAEYELAKKKNEIDAKQEAELIEKEEEKTLEEITNLKNSIEARKQATLKNIKKKEADELAKIDNEPQKINQPPIKEPTLEAIKEIKPGQKFEMFKIKPKRVLIKEKDQKPKRRPRTDGAGDIPDYPSDPSGSYKPKPIISEPPIKTINPIETINPIKIKTFPDITPVPPVDIEPIITISTLPDIITPPQTTTPVSTTPSYRQPATATTPTLKIPLDYYSKPAVTAQPHYWPTGGLNLRTSYTEHKLTPATSRKPLSAAPSLFSSSSYFPMVESNDEPISSSEQRDGSSFDSTYKTLTYETPEKEKPITPIKPAKLINKQPIIEEIQKPKEEPVVLKVPQIDLPRTEEAKKLKQKEEIHWFWRMIMAIEAYIRQLF